MEYTNLTERDLATVWHPYTQMKTAKPPIPIVRGEGACLIDHTGKSYIDAVSSWWVNIHGHAHPHIAQKVAKQLMVLEHAIFAGFTHPVAVELAEGLLKILPPNQGKIFYSDNGSTAVEVALKMCFQYWQDRGQQRQKVLVFNNSYHGDTFGAMAVSARSAFTAAFESMLFDVVYVDTPNKHNIAEIKALLAERNKDLASFIYEPLIQGSGGMLMYEAEYLDELIGECRKYGIFAIADEVMTGFGRTGRLFASEYMVNQPDIVCLSKGLTGGTMALGVTSCTDFIYNAFLSDDKYKTLFHGHSFTANPVACSAALASLDLTIMPETMTNIKRIEASHKRFGDYIRKHPKLKDVRQTGTIIAFEWNTGEDTSYFSGLRDRLYEYFLEEGIILRPLGNIIYILAPYCISDEQLEYVYSRIEKALDLF